MSTKMSFTEYLEAQDKANNTIITYTTAVDQFLSKYKNVSIENLKSYRAELCKTYRPKTINVKIQALNSYLDYLNKEQYRLKCVKIQSKSFCDKVINQAQYKRFLDQLYTQDNKLWYIAVRLMATTGLRISELLSLKIEDLHEGSIVILSKGRRLRRIFIPRSVQADLIRFLPDADLSEDIFQYGDGKKLSARVLSGKLKTLAGKCGIPEEVVYPHSFRHLFARNFIGKCNDIALLADLMGHESIETTRLYLRKTSDEQRAIVEEVVDW